MAFMKWNEDLSVKILSFDDQHKKLIGLINDFYEGFTKDKSQEKILAIVKGLKDYTVYHFSNEENYMTKFDYPEYEEHKKAHDAFIEKVKDYEDRLTQGKSLVSNEVTNFIKKWIIDHIMGIDKKYSNFLISKGVK